MKESDIRPEDLFDRYLELSKLDVKEFFGSKKSRISRRCPACDCGDTVQGFEKNNFNFVYCAKCFSLYVNPCPEPAQLEKFYSDSPSQNYWANTFFPAVSEARTAKVFKPRAEALKAMLLHNGVKGGVRIVDVGAGDGTMLNEIKNVGLGKEFVAVEPTPDLAEVCKSRGFRVFNCFAEAASKEKALVDSAFLVTSFEVFEHLVSPFDFLNHLSSICRKDGVVFLTGLFGSGFDIQVLGRHSKALTPPHHLNFISRNGLARLLKRCGLQEIYFSTPGKLDVDIVRNAFRKDSSVITEPFLRNLFQEDDPDTLDAFQEFLTYHNMSSHMWVLARKIES